MWALLVFTPPARDQNTDYLWESKTASSLDPACSPGEPRGLCIALCRPCRWGCLGMDGALHMQALAKNLISAHALYLALGLYISKLMN